MHSKFLQKLMFLTVATTLFACIVSFLTYYLHISSRINLNVSSVLYKFSKLSPDFRKINKYNRNYSDSFDLEYKQFAPALNGINDKVSPDIRRENKYNWNYSDSFYLEYKEFAPGLNDTEYSWYVELISEFKGRCEASNITYLLEAGSVLGAYRYHGFVPWDDDFDVNVNYLQNHVLEEALGSVPMHTLLKPYDDMWKFFNNNNSVRTPYKWNWPCIDIFFFKENKTHVFDVKSKAAKKLHPKGDILPLDVGLFENMKMPVPRNMEAFLKRKYDLQNPCVSNIWDHKRERPSKGGPRDIPCETLFNVYPLVHRLQENSGFPYEELRLGNKVLYTVKREVK